MENVSQSIADRLNKYKTARAIFTDIASQGPVTRTISLATRTDVRMTQKARSDRSVQRNKLYPKGIEKQAVGQYLVGFDYESSVNAQRLKEGKSPDFKEEGLWLATNPETGEKESRGVADSQLPAYFARHAKSGKQYLRVRPMTDTQGNVTRDQERYIDKATGEEITGDALEYAKRNFFPQPRKSKKQGLEDDVKVRAYELSNLAGVKGAEEGDDAWKFVTGPGESPEESAPARQPGQETEASESGGDAENKGNSLFDVFQNAALPSGSSPSWNEAARMENADRSYEQLQKAAAKTLQKVVGQAIGSAVGGPAGKAIGAIVGGGGNVGGTIGSALGGMVGGAPGAAIGGALGSMFSTPASKERGVTSGVGQVGSTSRGPGGSGGSSGEVVQLLRAILSTLQSFQTEGIKIHNAPPPPPGNRI